MKKILIWKSMAAGMKSLHGSVDWKINEWQKSSGTLSLCVDGFHASESITDAMNFVNCEILAKVEVKGKSLKEKDKQVWSEMRIVKAWVWTKEDSVRLAIFAAELVIGNFEKGFPKDDRPRKAIEVAKRFLKGKITKEEIESAAESAAESATESAAKSATRSAKSAAWSAAWSAKSAAESAAESAAKSAAESAAKSAKSAAKSAWSAKKYQEIIQKCDEFIIKLLNEKNE